MSRVPGVPRRADKPRVENPRREIAHANETPEGFFVRPLSHGFEVRVATGEAAALVTIIHSAQHAPVAQFRWPLGALAQLADAIATAANHFQDTKPTTNERNEDATSTHARRINT